MSAEGASASPNARSPQYSPAASPMKHADGRSDASGSPTPMPPPTDDHEHEHLMEEEERTLQADRRRLAKALLEAENREAEMVERHRREMDQLRAELERSINDRQQLESLVENAQSQQLVAEDSLTVQMSELEEAARLRKRLSHEAAAAAGLRDELDALREALDASARETAAEKKRLAETAEELENERKKAAAVADVKRRENAEFDAMLAAALEAKRVTEDRCRRLERDNATLATTGGNSSPSAREPAPATSPGPQVPQLKLRARGASVASAYASPDNLDSDRHNASFTRYAVGNVNSDSPDDRAAQANGVTPGSAGRGWARHRRGASNSSEQISPRGSSEVLRPPGDASPLQPNEHSALMRPSKEDRETQATVNATVAQRHTNRRPAPKKKEKETCPCVVA